MITCVYPQFPEGCQQPADGVKCQDSFNSEVLQRNASSSAMHSAV